MKQIEVNVTILEETNVCEGEGFYCADGLWAEWNRAIRQTCNLSANSGNLNGGQVSPRPGVGDVTDSSPAHK